MEHKNKEKLDWIIASNIDKGINLQTVYGTYLEIRELLQKKINECRKKDVVHYKDAFFEFQDQKIQATVIFETYHIFFYSRRAYKHTELRAMGFLFFEMFTAICRMRMEPQDQSV